MASDKQINDALEKIQSEVNGFIGASVVDMDSGMTLGARSSRPDFDLSTASAFNTEMVKQKLKIMKALNLKGGLEDMLLTLTDQLHLIKIVNPKTFIYLAADRSATNLAVMRASVIRQAETIK
jgi:predicted regulator of Ras-like GTPase activity (Roadblock/LC7/MglB family)